MITIILVCLLLWRILIIVKPDVTFAWVQQEVSPFFKKNDINDLKSRVKKVFFQKKKIYLFIVGLVILIPLAIYLIEDYYSNFRFTQQRNEYRYSRTVPVDKTNATVIKAMRLRKRPEHRKNVPGTDGLPVDARVVILDDCNTVYKGKRWCRVKWNGFVGYCSASEDYLLRD